MRREPDEIACWHGPEGAVILARRPLGLELRAPGERPGTGVSAAIEEVLGRPLDRRHPLARIVAGVETPPESPIIDATAGLGGDAAVAALAAPGRVVLACERHPMVGAVLEDGVRRAREMATERGREAAARIRVRSVDAVGLLAWFARTDPETGARCRPRPAVVVLDPMFPPRRKSSALPPKPMQRLRDLAETPDHAQAERESADLLRASAEAGAIRIVLKRPPDAPIPTEPLGSPTFTIETRLVRWLVWQGPADGAWKIEPGEGRGSVSS